ncbi:papilin-like [Contarinia nasturtii]|uniref:papilin-like n=1 Tax=Contarinia nasturtii TaxID=265458 RepID=UPI0012D3C881|nr:papilin-like [Contarinia nasturtii]
MDRNHDCSGSHGTYVCVADNGIGEPVQREAQLDIADPVQSNAYILGETNSSTIVELNRPATIRCLPGGYPKPHITWWKGRNMMPLKTSRFEVRSDHSIDFISIALSDLGPYICQAYSGEGRPVSKYVTLLAPGPVHADSPEDEQYLQYVVNATSLQPTPNYPPRQTPPVETQEPIGKQTLSQIYTNANLQLNFISITEANTLTIYGVTTDDSGSYRCSAQNRFTSAFHEEQINVEGAYVPTNCVDNVFFANCKLIVKAKYCTHQYYAKFCCKSCTLAGQLQSNFDTNLL